MNAQPSPHVRRRPFFLLAPLVAATLTSLAPSTAQAVTAPAVVTQRFVAADRYALQADISKSVFPASHPSAVYIARGDQWQYPLVAGAVAGHSVAGLLLTAQSTLPTSTRAELVRLAPSRVVLVGGTTIIAADVATAVAAALPGATIERVPGSDPDTVAAALSARTYAAGSVSTAFVVSGSDSTYDLAVGPAAAKAGAAVLFTRSTGLPPVTASELRRLQPQSVELVGSAAGVGSSSAAIAGLGPTVVRTASDRYATAAHLSKRYFPTATAIVVATGIGAVNAMAAIPLAAAAGAPLLLTSDDDILPTATRDETIRLRPARILIVAGASIPEIVRGELTGFADGRLTVPPAAPRYPSYDSRYHDYGEMVTIVKSAEIAFPAIVHVFSIGKSYEGRDIWAAKISDNVAIDEAEPEVYVDTLNHAREHIGVEQALYLLRTLTQDYATDATAHRLVDSREIWIVFAVNPDGWAYDLQGTSTSAYRGWRKNRQPTPGSTSIGTDLNRNYGYKWGCCGGSSGTPSSYVYRGPAAFSAPETRAVRDFIASRVVNGTQQIKTSVSLHAPGENVMWPYGYTNASLPPDMSADDHATFVAMGRAMAARNGYRPMQSGDWYVNDGDEHDWLYGTYGIFAYTFELYPLPQTTLQKNFYPPDEVIATQTARNRSALLYLIDMAGCPYAAIGKAAQYCGA